MNQLRNKRQHITPQFYLRGFADHPIHEKEDPAIWRYSKNTNEVKRKGIKNVGWSAYFYSWGQKDGTRNNSVDNNLKSIEDAAAPAIKRIDENVSFLINNPRANIKDQSVLPNIITEMDYDVLLVFMLNLMRRSKKLIDNIIDGTNSVLDEVFEGLNKQPQREQTKKAAIQAAMDIGSPIRHDFKKIFETRQPLIFFIPNESTSLITTDNPICMYNTIESNGLQNESTHILFPVNQRCLLALVGKKYGPILYNRLEGKKETRELNGFIIGKMHEFAYGRDKRVIEVALKHVSV